MVVGWRRGNRCHWWLFRIQVGKMRVPAIIQKHPFITAAGVSAAVWLLLREMSSGGDLDLTPPWAGYSPQKLNTLQHYFDVPLVQSKIEIAQIAKWLQQNGGNPKPTYEQFKQQHTIVANALNIHPNLIRGYEYYESGKSPKPLDINGKTTAAGLGSSLVDSTRVCKIPYVWVLWWKAGIWATAAELVISKHWSWGWWLPTASEISIAASLAGTSSEPSWFKVGRAYYSLDPAKLEKSTKYTAQRFNMALAGFDAATDSSLSEWNEIHSDKMLTKFYNGTAKDINYEDA
jgi:hypothetical protein